MNTLLLAIKNKWNAHSYVYSGLTGMAVSLFFLIFQALLEIGMYYWESLEIFSFLFPVIWLFSTMLSLIAVLFLLPLTLMRYKGNPKSVGALLLMVLGYLCLTPLLPLTHTFVKKQMDLSLIEGVEPLMHAIRSFETDFLHPPKTLEELVPKYISALPDQGSSPLSHYYFESPTAIWTPNNRNGTPKEWKIYFFTTFHKALVYVSDENFGDVEEVYDNWAILPPKVTY